MTPQLISIYALVAMFVVATLWPINMGVLAFVGAFLVGTLLAGQKAAEIIDGFPGGLFLTLVGITWLFALAQPLLVQNWLAGALAVPGFALLYFLRVNEEERLMLDSFGEEYRAYMARTGRLWPRWRAAA